jgi:hypothetical protein
MKHPRKAKERRWVIFDNGCIHGIQHSELTVIRSRPRRSVMRDSVSVFTISKPFAVIAALAVVVALVLLLAACQTAPGQKGGVGATAIKQPGHTSTATLAQSENPKEPSHQTVQSEQTIEYVLPPGTSIELASSGAAENSAPPGRSDAEAVLVTAGKKAGRSYEDPSVRGGTNASGLSMQESQNRSPTAVLSQPMPVRRVIKDHTETSIGAAQKDTLREWAGKAASVRPVMWAGIAMMTLVAGAFVYFGWWTKAALAVGVGLGMIILAQTLPDCGGTILFGGIGVFALAALLVLYAYHKGQLDKNHNGIPDFLEKTRDVPF